MRYFIGLGTAVVLVWVTVALASAGRNRVDVDGFEVPAESGLFPDSPSSDGSRPRSHLGLGRITAPPLESSARRSDRISASHEPDDVETAPRGFGELGSLMLFDGSLLGSASDREIAEHVRKTQEVLTEMSGDLMRAEAAALNANKELAALGHGDSRLAGWLRTLDPADWPEHKVGRQMYKWTEVTVPTDWGHNDMLWLQEKVQNRSWAKNGRTAEQEVLEFLLSDGRELALPEDRRAALLERYPHLDI